MLNTKTSNSLIAISLLGWVAVMNPDGIKNFNRLLPFGDLCDLESIQHRIPMGLVGNEVLYRATHMNDPGGVVCPPGTLFFLTSPDMLDPSAREPQEVLRRRQLKQKVEDLLRQREREE